MLIADPQVCIYYDKLLYKKPALSSLFFFLFYLNMIFYCLINTESVWCDVLILRHFPIHYLAT